MYNNYILNYLMSVEMKDKISLEWTEVLVTKDAECKAVVEGLKEGQTYQFRVKARNVSHFSVQSIQS